MGVAFYATMLSSPMQVSQFLVVGLFSSRFFLVLIPSSSLLSFYLLTPKQGVALLDPQNRTIRWYFIGKGVAEASRVLFSSRLNCS